MKAHSIAAAYVPVGAYSLGTLPGLKGLAWLTGYSPRAAEVGIHANTTR